MRAKTAASSSVKGRSGLGWGSPLTVASFGRASLDRVLDRRRPPLWVRIREWSQTSEGDCSGRCWDPDVAAGQFGEDVEGAAAVLGRGGQVGAHRGEVLGTGEGAHAPGHLLLDLDHPDVAFGRVVVERDSRVGGEAQVVLEASVDAAGPGAVPGGRRARRAR